MVLKAVTMRKDRLHAKLLDFEDFEQRGSP